MQIRTFALVIAIPGLILNPGIRDGEICNHEIPKSHFVIRFTDRL